MGTVHLGQVYLAAAEAADAGQAVDKGVRIGERSAGVAGAWR